MNDRSKPRRPATFRLDDPGVVVTEADESEADDVDGGVVAGDVDGLGALGGQDEADDRSGDRLGGDRGSRRAGKSFGSCIAFKERIDTA